MKLKDASVKMKDIQPQIVLAIMLVDEVMGDITITSINDGHHKEGSLHYKGMAFDIRTHDIPSGAVDRVNTLNSLKNKVKNALGDDFDVIIENASGPNEHMHCEYDPKP